MSWIWADLMRLDPAGVPYPPEFDLRESDRLIWMARGFATAVSSVDYDRLAAVTWTPQIDPKNEKVYARRSSWGGVKRKVYMHRVVTDCPDGLVVDHINGNPLDNRRENLRVVQVYENMHNVDYVRGKWFRGVTQCRRRFQARISVHGVREYLGSFGTPEEAAEAYDRRALELFGPFAWINFRDDATLGVESVVEEDIPF